MADLVAHGRFVKIESAGTTYLVPAAHLVDSAGVPSGELQEIIDALVTDGVKLKDENDVLVQWGDASPVYPGVPETPWSYAGPTGGITDTADDVLKAAVASLRNYLTGIQIKNTHATVATEVVVKDGSTVIWRDNFKALMLNSDVIKFDPPLFSTANTALNVACITTGSATYVNAQGYTAA